MSESLSKFSPFGLWHVSTEGDDRGLSLHSLGIYMGFLDEIAFALAGHARYSLGFSYVVAQDYSKFASQDRAHVSLNIDGLDLDNDKQFDLIKDILGDRPVTIMKSNRADVKLIRGAALGMELKAKAEARMRALAKLSKDDIEALGINPE